MRNPTIDSLNESTIASDMSSVESVKSSNCCIEDSGNRSGAETDSSISSMDDKCITSQSNEVERDSGLDSGEPDFIVPDKELCNQILNQVESYFSDENLMKDEFILKHIRRNKEGFISLKLVASLRKVKVLTKNWKVVQYCIAKHSKRIEMNESGTKIRRITRLPEVDGSKSSRTLIAYNLPNESNTAETIGSIFQKYGDVSLIRIFKPNPEVMLSSHLISIIGNKFDTSKTTFASIEFNRKSDAETVLEDMEKNKKTNWRSRLSVISMDLSNTRNQVNDNLGAKVRRCGFHLKNAPNNRQINNKDSKDSAKCPIFRRQKSKSYSAGDDSHPANIHNFTSRLPLNIIRYPSGPDGTKGFNQTRNKRSNSEP